jgi:hypothetical protein
VDLWDLTRLIFRRWYFAVPILLVTLTGVLFASRSVRPDYSATGHLQLVPPATPNEPETAKAGRIHNPWLDLGIEALGQAAVLKIQDEKTIKQLGAAGYSETFTVTIDYPATFVSIEGIGSSPDQATRTVQKVMDLLTDDVKAEQAQFGVAKQDQILTVPLDKGDKVTKVTSKVKRVLIVAGAIAMLITTGATIGLDAILRKRARRRAAAEAKAVAEGGPDPSRDDSDATSVVPAQRINGVLTESVGAGAKRPIKGAEPAVKALPAGTTKQPAAAAKAGATKPAKPSDPAHDDDPTTIISVPRAGEGEAGKSRRPIMLEYQQTAGSEPADEAKGGQIDEDPPIPSDATIVLPLSHKYWDVRNSGAKRR